MQYELNLRDYIRIFQKRKWILILMPILAGLLGFFLTPEPPTTYRASGKVRITKRSMPSEALLDAYYYIEEGSRLDTHAAVITSRQILIEVGTCLELLPPGTDPDADLARCGDGREIPVLDDERLMERDDWLGLLAQLAESIEAEVVPSTSILEISVTTPRPDMSVRWVNTLLETYEAHHSYEVNKAIIDSLAFLHRQLDEVAEDLRDSERRLAEFKRDNANTISLRSEELGDVQDELERVELQIRAIDYQIGLLEQALDSGRVPSFELLTYTSAENLQIVQLRTELVNLQQNRQNLLEYQTPASPEVQRTENRIRDRLQLMMATLEGERSGLERERERLEQKFRTLPANDVLLAGLERDRRINEQLYQTLLTDLQQAELRDMEKAQEVTVIELAVDAEQVTETSRANRGLLAAVIGVLLGVVVALVVETLDTSIGAIEDVESLLEVPVIGIIPPIDFDEIRDIIRGVSPEMLEHPEANELITLVTHYDPRAPVAEAYRALRTNIEKARARVDGKVLVMTSSVLEEGKTTTTVNLALTYAQMGRKTLLIAADLRRPQLHRVFGLEKEPGLADVLTGSVEWRSATRGLSDILLGEMSMDVVMLTPGMDNLHVLPSGSNPLNPAELLSSEATATLIRELRDSFDLIILDTPPVIPVTDPAILAEHADGVVIVYEVGKVGRDVLKRAKAHLDNVSSDLWGIVMNDVKAEAETTLRDTDYYYYHYRYEESSHSRGRSLWDRAAGWLFNSGRG